MLFSSSSGSIVRLSLKTVKALKSGDLNQYLFSDLSGKSVGINTLYFHQVESIEETQWLMDMADEAAKANLLMVVVENSEPDNVALVYGAGKMKIKSDFDFAFRKIFADFFAESFKERNKPVIIRKASNESETVCFESYNILEPGSEKTEQMDKDTSIISYFFKLKKETNFI